MKSLKLYSIYCFLLSCFLVSAINSRAQEIPERPDKQRLVNDFADVLSGEEQQLLEEKLLAFYKKSSTQIAFVSVSDLQGYDISDYSFKLAEKWGIGKKSKNNGVLVLMSLEPRKIFIATGYGVEEYLTDAYSKRIVETIIKPEFKQKQFYEGLDKGTDAIIGILEGKFVPDEEPAKGKKSSTFVIIVVFIIIVIILSRRGNRGGHRRIGGIGGMPFIGGGGWSDFSSRGSSFGDSGGGFGGFGGGSFGGGGAGGDW